MTGVERNRADRGLPKARRDSRSKPLLYLLAAVVFAAVLASRLPALNQPFGRDQGIFACVGRNILKGLVPYRDLWDQKPPGIHFTYALLIRLFGDSMRAVQSADLAVLVLTAYMIYSVVREISGKRAGVFAMLIYFFYSDPLFYGYSSGYWARSQAETYMAPFLIAGLWVFVRFLRSRSGWLVWLAGLFWGAAFLYKYTAVLFPLCALVFLGLYLRSIEGRLSRHTVHSLGRTIVVLGCGFGTSLVPVLIYFGANHALKDLFAVTVLYNLKYLRAVSTDYGGSGFMPGQLEKWVLRNPFLWLTGIAGGIAVAVRARKDGIAPILLFWLAAALAAIALNQRYFHYHFIQMAAPLAMLSAYILSRSIGWMKKRNRWILIVPALAACILLLVPDIQKVRQALKPDIDLALGKTRREVYWARFVTGDFSFLADKYLADYLEERTGPGDPIFIFGFEPLVYFLAGRTPASRYIYNDPVTAAYVSPETRGARLEQMLADLERSMPMYVVIVEGDSNPVDRTDSYTFFMNTEPLRLMLENWYTSDRQARKFHIYRRKSG